MSETFTGKVTEVGSTADAASRAFTIKISLHNPKLLIRPGMIAEVTLASNQSKALVLPTEAVFAADQDNQSYVFVADPGVRSPPEKKG